MKKAKKIMKVAIPHPEAADLAIKAAQAGVPTDEFIGIQALAGAYGHSHPDVQAFRNRPKAGVCGTKTPKAPEGGQ